MNIGEQNHPFYRPLWRRVLIVAVCAGWLALEAFQAGSGLWTVIAGAALAYAVWFLFITYKPDDKAQG